MWRLVSETEQQAIKRWYKLAWDDPLYFFCSTDKALECMALW